MKINSIKVNGFGKLKDKQIELTDGINIVYGNNESGKTTIQKFIFGMLYGMSKNKNGREISDFDKYKPWDGSEFSGKIKYTLDNNKSFEIFREFKKKKPQIYNEFGEEISSKFKVDKTKGIEFLNEQVNVDENSFINTSMIEQQCIKLEKNDANNMVQKISNLVSTGDDSISFKKSMDKINKLQNDNIGNDRTKNRPINIVDEKIKKLLQDKKELNVYKNYSNNYECQQEALNKEIEKLQIKKENLKKQNRELQDNKIHIAEAYAKSKIYKIIMVINLFLALLSIALLKNIVIFIAFFVATVISFIFIKKADEAKEINKDNGVDNIDHQVEKIDNSINDLKVQKSLLENERKNIDEKLSSLMRIEEELEEEQNIKKELNELNVSYELAKECLENAYEEIKHNISPKFEQKLCEVVSKVTDGKYNKVSVNDDAGLLVETENGSYVSADRLSIGTIDEMYLSFRLSMLSEISDESMPIILDESFVYFDNNRLRNILRYLQDKNYNDQIIIFTCSDREERILNELKIEYNLITLEK